INTYSLKQHQLLRQLHSFPTRRSSDLASSNRDRSCRSTRKATRRNRRAVRRSDSAHQQARNCPDWRSTAAAAACDISPIRTITRSEEHTSELQSQSNLVCRLLLEKKKM